MSSLTTIFLAPPLVLLSVPLFIFAIFTTSLAFLALGARVSIVYVELFISVLQNVLSPSRTVTPYIRRKLSTPAMSQKSTSSSSFHFKRSQPSSPTHVTKSLRRMSSTTTNSSLPSSKSGSTTPKGPSFASNDPLSCSGIYMSGSAATTTPLNRDFEGIGGWRMPLIGAEEAGDAEREDELWTGMNKRLELPLPIPIVLQKSAANSRSNLRDDHDRGQGKERKHARRMTSGAIQVGKRMKDNISRMTPSNSSKDRAMAKIKGKEVETVGNLGSKTPSIGKDRRRNKSMVTLGEGWTANTGRPVGLRNGL